MMNDTQWWWEEKGQVKITVVAIVRRGIAIVVIRDGKSGHAYG